MGIYGGLAAEAGTAPMAAMLSTSAFDVVATVSLKNRDAAIRT
jgi:hypothetical protein